jgi:hypothetical protein
MAMTSPPYREAHPCELGAMSEIEQRLLNEGGVLLDDGLRTLGRYGTIPDNEVYHAHGSVFVEGEEVRYTAAYPEYVVEDGYQLLIPGFGAFKRISRSERDLAAQAGKVTVSYDPPRVTDGGTVTNLTDAQRIHETAITAIANHLPTNREARNMPNGNSLGYDRIRLSPHSMGGEPAIRFALDNHDRIESIVLRATVGFGTPRLSLFLSADPARFAQEAAGYVFSGQLELTPRNLLRAIKYYGRVPSRTVGEFISCFMSDLSDETEELGQLGVPVAYLGYEKDKLVPPEQARPKAEPAVKAFHVLKGSGHVTPQKMPATSAVSTLNVHHEISIPALTLV